MKNNSSGKSSPLEVATAAKRGRGRPRKKIAPPATGDGTSLNNNKNNVSVVVASQRPIRKVPVAVVSNFKKSMVIANPPIVDVVAEGKGKGCRRKVDTAIEDKTVPAIKRPTKLSRLATAINHTGSRKHGSAQKLLSKTKITSKSNVKGKTSAVASSILTKAVTKRQHVKGKSANTMNTHVKISTSPASVSKGRRTPRGKATVQVISPPTASGDVKEDVIKNSRKSAGTKSSSSTKGKQLAVTSAAVQFPPVDATAVLTDMWCSDFQHQYYNATCGPSTADSDSITATTGSMDIRDTSMFDFKFTCSSQIGIIADTGVVDGGKNKKPLKIKTMLTANDVHKSMSSSKQRGEHDLIEPAEYTLPIGAECPPDSASTPLECGEGEDILLVCPPQQPFLVMVHPQVSMVCDVHAHMCEAEVIGLLAGHWAHTSNDCNSRSNILMDKKCLFVQQAFPCVAVASDDDDGSTDVELDSESEWKAREAIIAAGMTVVGWYHSHPKFKPFPSVIDIFNQKQYQQLLREDDTGLEPFVGLIVATYDKSVHAAPAVHQWFQTVPHTVAGRKQETFDVPMSIRVNECSAKAHCVYTQDMMSQVGVKNLLLNVRKPSAHISSSSSSSNGTSIVVSDSIAVQPSVDESLRGRVRKRKLPASLDIEMPGIKEHKKSPKCSNIYVENPPADVATSHLLVQVNLADCLLGTGGVLQEECAVFAPMAIELLSVSPTVLRCMVLSLVSLSLYYRKYDRRVELVTETWKKFGPKLNKLILSITRYFDMLVLDDVEYKSEFLVKFKAFLNACWK